MYKRYIDDLFFIWKGNESDFNGIVHNLNNNTWGLSFSGTIFKHKLEYLDLEMSIENNQIITKTYLKSVDCNSLLHFQSSHYRKWLLKIPYGQMKHLRKNCFRDSNFEQQSKTMKSRFLEKGYPITVINDTINKTSRLTQKLCLEPKDKSTENSMGRDFGCNFITTFNRSHNHIRGILNKYWPILYRDPHLTKSLPKDRV